MDAFNSIELTLKTPNQRVNDIQLKCREDWTIKNLKEHLQDVYPSKPVSIIYKNYFTFFTDFAPCLVCDVICPLL